MTEFLEKINQLDADIGDRQVHEQAQEVAQIISHVARQQVLPAASDPLGLMPDELEEIASRVGEAKRRQLDVINHLFNGLRQFLSVHYGVWSVPNRVTARLFKQLGVISSLEIMAGNGFWSKALSEAGVATVATDSFEWARTSATGHEPCHPVVRLDAPSAIRRFSSVQLIICSWAPNFNKSDMQAIAAWEKYNPGAHLIFIGEKRGATNSPTFWQTARLGTSPALRRINRSLRSFDFINEQAFEIKHEI